MKPNSEILISLILVLVLTIANFLTSVPTTKAETINTICNLVAIPSEFPIGKYAPPYTSNHVTYVGTIDPNLPDGNVYTDLYLKITWPDGHVGHIGPFTSEYSEQYGKQTKIYNWWPSQIGSYSVTFYFLGETILGDWYAPSESSPAIFTVTANELPVATFIVSSSNSAVDEIVSFDASGSYDPDGGDFQEYVWDFGDGTTGTGILETHAYTSPGTYIITLTVTDDEGWTDTATANIHVNPAPPTDTTPPIGSVVINGGATDTNSQSVTLTLSAEDPESGVIEMRFSNDGSSWSSWESYSTSKSWTLTSGDGTKTVYVQFNNEAELISSTYSDTITLDTDTAPPTDTTPPIGSVVINGGATDTNSQSVTLTLSAEDPESGVAYMRFSNDGNLWTEWEAYATSKFWNLEPGDGEKVVHVQFQNGAEHHSEVYSDVIGLDTGKGDSSISISMSATTFTVGESTSISGYLEPSHEGASVTMECRPIGETWATIERLTTSSDGGYWYTWTPTTAGTYEVKVSWEGDENTVSCQKIGQLVTVKPSTPAAFPLWILVPVIGGISGVTTILVYFKRRKPREEVLKPAEPTVTEEPIEIPAPAKKTGEKVLKPAEEISPQKVKELPKLSTRCTDTIALLKNFIEDPSRKNDRKAWKGFREFITIAEQIEDEYAELAEIRNNIAILRRKRNEYRRAGLDDLADKVEGDIQSNYDNSIRIIKEIQEKLPHLGG